MNDGKKNNESSAPGARHGAATAEMADAQWRGEQRAALRAKRAAAPAAMRRAAAAQIARQLDKILDLPAGRSIAVYWPLPGEPDLRSWYSQLAGRGWQLSLPVVVARNQPLEFRPWRPGDDLVQDILHIACPPPGSSVVPDVILAPCVGFDQAGYRLGNGGGYYDRTLASLPARPQLIGIAWECLKLATIRPQPHDVPFEFVVTEKRVIAGKNPG